MSLNDFNQTWHKIIAGFKGLQVSWSLFNRANAGNTWLVKNFLYMLRKFFMAFFHVKINTKF